MRRLLACTLLPIAAAVGGPAAAQPADTHPLVGKWTWKRSANNCTEVYEFRADGTAYVISGDERSDNTYTVTKEPDARGFYKLTLKVTKDHGGRDCADQDRDDTGLQSINYIRFEPDRDTQVWCRKPNLETCFGPLRRTP